MTDHYDQREDLLKAQPDAFAGKQRTVNLQEWLAPTNTPLGAAIKALQDRGHEVGLTGDIPGLFSVDGAPGITANQLVQLSSSPVSTNGGE